MVLFRIQQFLFLLILLLAARDKGIVSSQNSRQPVIETRPVVPDVNTRTPNTVFYNRLLTPEDLREYVTPNIRNDLRTTRLQISKEVTPGVQRLLRIPLIPPSQLTASQSYYLHVTAGMDQQKTSNNANIIYTLSDGRNVSGFVLPSIQDNTTVLCFGIEGKETSPNGLDRSLNEYRQINRDAERVRQKRDDEEDDDDDDDDDDCENDDRSKNFISGKEGVVVTNLRDINRVPVNETTLLFKPGRQWGSCSAVEYSTFTSTVRYRRSIDPSRGLFFDVYLGSEAGNFNLLYLLIKLVRETSLL